MWKHPSRLVPTLLLLWPFQAHAANFTFSYGAATECDDFEVSWQGGQAPFRLTIVPSYGTPKYLNIPNNAFSNNRGTFKTTMNLPEQHDILAVMSDSSGFGSGGVSPVITIGKQLGKTQCNTTDPGVDFFYETNSALAQCRLYLFDGYPAAIQPVTIMGLVPGGSTFVLNPPRGAANFNWLADVAAGTRLAFLMQDANGRQGGSTEFMVVGMSDDPSCLDSNSPASVTNAPSLTSSQSSTPTDKPDTGKDGAQPDPQISTPATSDPANSSNAGTVAAAIVGTIVAMLVVGALIWFYLRRRIGGTSVHKGGFFGRRSHKQELDLVKGDSGPPPHASLNPYPLYPQPGHSDVSTPNSTHNLLGGRPSFSATTAFGGASSLNFAHPPNSSSTSQFPPMGRPDSMYDGSAYGGVSSHGGAAAFGGAAGYGAGVRPEGSVASWDQTVTSSAARRKAAQAGVSTYQPPARFILHTDLEDDIPPPPEEEVIELPPQYSERRAPPAGSTSPTDQRSQASSSGLPYSDRAQDSSSRPS